MNGQSIRNLNSELREMLRISQRSVDYATKAYASGRAEFAQQAQREREKMDKVVQKIFASTAGSHAAEETDAQMRYFGVVRAISLALLTTCQYAHEVSLHAAALSNDGVLQRSHDLLRMGEQVNGLMRLCIVAVMNKNPEYAETVLRNTADWKYDFADKRQKESATGSLMPAGHFQERLIANSFQRMIENVRTIASAVSCYCHWLKRLTAAGPTHGLWQAS